MLSERKDCNKQMHTKHMQRSVYKISRRVGIEIKMKTEKQILNIEWEWKISDAMTMCVRQSCQKINTFYYGFFSFLYFFFSHHLWNWRKLKKKFPRSSRWVCVHMFSLKPEPKRKTHWDWIIEETENKQNHRYSSFFY